MTHEDTSKRTLILGIVLLFALAVLGYATFTLRSQVADLTSRLATVTAEKESFVAQNATSLTSLSEASTTIAALSSKLSLTADELSGLKDDYVAEKKKNDNFSDQIRDIAGTVGDLDKLSKTDKELLQKYSKVYFLNEHFIPEKIVTLDKKYTYNETVSKSIHAKVEPYLSNMIDAAQDDGIKLWVVSGYRSFREQASLKGAYTTSYGSGANTFSADQGYSEHQLGTAVDFTTEGIGGGLAGFGDTKAFTWLSANAHKYGFTLSYPKGNKYYVYEPWHWRFVGTDLAKDLHKDGKFFYDLDQRKIDEYLIKIFD